MIMSMKKELYLKPVIRVAEIKNESILAGSIPPEANVEETENIEVGIGSGSGNGVGLSKGSSIYFGTDF